MMQHNRNLNFAPREQRNIRLLQVGALSAFLGCVAMTGLLLRPSATSTATIADSIVQPSAAPASSRQSLLRPKAISENTVLAASLEDDGDSVRYVEKESGRAFSVALGTLKTSALSQIKRAGLLRSSWLPHTTSAIIETQESNGTSYQLIDFSSSAAKLIGSDITSLATSPDGRRIAFLKLTHDAAELFVSQRDGSDPLKVLTTRAQDVSIEWPSRDAIALQSRRADHVGSDLSVISPAGDLVVVFSNLQNLEYRWAPDGSRILFSHYTPEQGVSLWIHDIQTGEDAPLHIPTSADKCAWHSSLAEITCGVPTQVTLGGTMPARQTASVDDVVTITVAAGESRTRYQGSKDLLISVIDPLISSTEAHFVFTNLVDQRLYVLPLK